MLDPAFTTTTTMLPEAPWGKSRRWRRSYRSSRRHFRNRQRAAAVRALTAARLRLNGSMPTLAKAAAACGSNAHYVRAGIVLIKSENAVMMDRVLRGDVPLLAAAAELERLADLVSAFRKATAQDQAVFGKIVGVDAVFDGAVVPSL